jgi:hypothetical protein
LLWEALRATESTVEANVAEVGEEAAKEATLLTKRAKHQEEMAAKLTTERSTEAVKQIKVVPRVVDYC